MRFAEEAAEAETALEQLYADWQQADDALQLLLEQEEE